MAKAGARCEYQELISSHGHDAFLAEPDELARLIRPFLV
jgi:homoserine O-acetyltransferase